jgi:hypothetical protein
MVDMRLFHFTGADLAASGLGDKHFSPSFFGDSILASDGVEIALGGVGLAPCSGLLGMLSTPSIVSRSGFFGVGLLPCSPALRLFLRVLLAPLLGLRFGMFLMGLIVCSVVVFLFFSIRHASIVARWVEYWKVD